VILGLDLAFRNSGFCLIDDVGNVEQLSLLKTEGDLVKVLSIIRPLLREYLSNPLLKGVSLERPINTSVSGPLLTVIQVMALEVITESGFDGFFVNPLPIQLRSYLKRFRCINPESKKAVVSAFVRDTGRLKVSDHEADAYYLAQFARAVFNGHWAYNPPSDKVQFHSIPVFYCKGE